MLCASEGCHVIMVVIVCLTMILECQNMVLGGGGGGGGWKGRNCRGCVTTLLNLGSAGNHHIFCESYTWHVEWLMKTLP